VGAVAVDALGGGVVGGFGPGVVLVIHDVAVGAGFGVGGEVGEAFGVVEGEEADAEEEAEEDGEGEGAFAEGEGHVFWIVQDG